MTRRVPTWAWLLVIVVVALALPGAAGVGLILLGVEQQLAMTVSGTLASAAAALAGAALGAHLTDQSWREWYALQGTRDRRGR